MFLTIVYTTHSLLVITPIGSSKTSCIQGKPYFSKLETRHATFKTQVYFSTMYSEFASETFYIFGQLKPIQRTWIRNVIDNTRCNAALSSLGEI